jgi:nanoRNase/pAp phosphatase (c-di-AMP/oligoRNAs hydrolase)
MMVGVDKGDSAQFTEAEVLKLEGWDLLNMLMDSRTGLSRFREFKISIYQLMMQLIDYCGNHTVNQIVALPDVKERVDLYFDHEGKFKDQIKRCSTVMGNLVVLDLRNEETIYAGNRFMIYALFPYCNISIHILWGLNKLNTVLATDKSILNKTSNTNIGELMLKYDGGDHENAGTCQVENEDTDRVFAELTPKITTNG